MAEQASEKKHEATGKRIEEMRRTGQTMRSKDLTSGLVFIVAITMVIYMSSQIKTRLEDNFMMSFSSMSQVIHSQSFPSILLKKIAIENFLVLLPVFIIVVIAALFSPFIFGGWNFSLQALTFKAERMNPVSNLKNLFSIKIVYNILKSMLKVTVVVGLLVMFVLSKQVPISGLINLTLSNAIDLSFSIIHEYTIMISISLVMIILYDVISNYFEYQTKIKMTTQEIKDEHKETEGNSDVKRKLRSVQFAILKQRLSLTVPKAHVIITNPTHYAVAVRYDTNRDKAPIIVAKGKDYIAQQIRQIAISNGIPIYQAPLLARAVYNTSKIGSEIKPGLYMSVAIVLSYVHQLKSYQHGIGREPQYVSDLKIPEEFIYQE